MDSKYIMNVALAALMTMPIVGCSEDDVIANDGLGLQATDTYFAVEDAKKSDIYLKPYVGYVGDPMPFYDKASQTFKILYLQDFDGNDANVYHPIYELETADAGSYVNHGEAIACGDVSEDDPALGTGSTIMVDGKYYTFYTGHKASSPREVILKAVSDDGVNWTKDRSFRLQAPDNYNQDEFRDPYVFYDEDAQIYRMVVSAIKDGTSVLAQFTSTDLTDWTETEPFFHNKWGRFYECPDIFQMGNYWYLVYSDKDITNQVQYFYANSLNELMNMGDDPAFPSRDEGKLEGGARSFYAGKTASDGTNRYIWGWCDRRDGTNEGSTIWAGALVAHKLVQDSDGLLGFDCPDGVKNQFTTAVDVNVLGNNGATVSGDNTSYTLASGTSVRFARLNYTNKIEFDVTTNPGESVFGISFVDGSDIDYDYRVYIEDRWNALKFDKVTSAEGGSENRQNINYLGFIHPEDGKYHVTIISDQSVCVTYINGQYAFTNRVYGMQRNPWSLFCSDGSVEISNLTIATTGE